MAKPNKFLDRYKTYDPEKEGYGSPESWRDALTYRMGLKEARERVGDDSPHEILGVALNATWAEIKSAYRKLALECHPDRGAVHGIDVEEATRLFKRLVAAYTVLEARHGK